MARPPQESVALLRRRAVLLRIWRLTPDPGVRETIEADLYGEAHPERAAAEAERLSEVAVDLDVSGENEAPAN